MSSAALATQPSTNADPRRRARRWQPPLTATELQDVLAKARAWQPLHLPAVYDDLDRMLGEHTPAPEEVAEVGERLRGVLIQLAAIAVADPRNRPSPETLTLVERGRVLGDREMPGGHRQGLGLARRMAWTAADLIEHLIAAQHLKDTD
jgi:hypothetical protein